MYIQLRSGYELAIPLKKKTQQHRLLCLPLCLTGKSDEPRSVGAVFVRRDFIFRAVLRSGLLTELGAAAGTKRRFFVIVKAALRTDRFFAKGVDLLVDLVKPLIQHVNALHMLIEVDVDRIT